MIFLNKPKINIHLKKNSINVFSEKIRGIEGKLQKKGRYSWTYGEKRDAQLQQDRPKTIIASLIIKGSDILLLTTIIT